MKTTTTTTLNEIKTFKPCESGWKILLESLPPNFDKNAPISYKHILDSNGIDDAIWSLRTCKELAVHFTCLCAEEVLPIFEKRYPKDLRPRKAIEAARNWIKNHDAAAADAAYAAYAAADAAADAAYAAADAAAYAAADAAYAAYAAAYAAADAAAYAAADAAYAAYAADADVSKITFKTRLFLQAIKLQ